MRHAVVGALLIAAVSTLGDFVWAGLQLRHRVGYGLSHGAILFLCMGAYLGWIHKKPLTGALYGAAIGFAAAGSFYLLAPVAGYSVMFFVWAFIWMALAVLVGRILPVPSDPTAAAGSSVVLRGLLAMIGSGIGFYLISGIWRPFDPRGWHYAVHFLSWTIAYLPGFLALLALRKPSH
jgi:hypothetical protein